MKIIYKILIIFCLLFALFFASFSIYAYISMFKWELLGKMAIFSNRIRIGDLLVHKGYITEDQLSDRRTQRGARVDHHEGNQSAAGGGQDPFGLRARLHPRRDRVLRRSDPRGLDERRQGKRSSPQRRQGIRDAGRRRRIVQV